MIVVSDTSPITTLIQVGQETLLHQLYGEILIPEAVQRELAVLHPQLPEYFQVKRVVNRSEVDRLLQEIDPGEAEAIILAKELHADALLIDEREGRAVAAREGVRFIGLIGVLVFAKRRGLMTSLAGLLQMIETRTPFHFSRELRAQALRSVGEL
jgi:uncharacterized protein